VLSKVDALLSGATDVTALLLEGEAGIGKSTVLREAAVRAERGGYRVLSCSPSASEARWSYAALADLLGPVDDRWFDILPAPQRGALRVALLRDDGDGVRPARRAVATATGSLLSAFASDQPLAVVIDDVQWLDVATARALEFALRRLHTSHLVVLASRRTDAAGTQAPSLFDGLPADSVIRTTLGPLDAPAIHSLLIARLGRTLPGPQLRKLADTTRGNPFYALEVARLLDDDPRDGAAVPRDLQRLVTNRVERIPAHTRRSLLRVAAATRPTTALLSTADQEIAVGAGIATVDGDRVTFVHPLFASAVYRSASATDRRAAHRDLATRVAEPEERARHLALSTVRPAESIAATLMAAAEHARAVGALDAAADLALFAVARTPKRDAARRTRRQVIAAAYLVRAGDTQRAVEVLDAVLTVAPRGRTRGEALRLLGEVRYHDHGYHDALTLIAEALDQDEAGDFQVPTLLANAYAVFSAGDPSAAAGLGRRALELAEELGDDALIAESLAVVTAGRGFGGHGVDWDGFARAIQLEDRSRELPIHMRPSVLAAEQTTYYGRLAAAAESLTELRTWFVQRGDEGDLPYLLFFLALCRWWQGRFEESIEAADHAAMLTLQAGNDAMHGLALAHRGRANAALGRLDAAHEDVERGLALLEPTGWVGGIAVARSGSGFLALSTGDPTAAARALAPLAEGAALGHGGWMAVGLVLPDLVEALAQVGDDVRASAVIDAFTTTYSELDVPWLQVGVTRSRALVHAARGELDQALALAQEASTASASCEMPLETARCLLVQGELERRTRKRAAARRSLERAVAICDEIGAPLWSSRAAIALTRLGGRTASGELTVTEARVARLAAEGLANSEIAAKLFVSRRTVEANLSRSYSKLGIRSRAQLNAALG